MAGNDLEGQLNQVFANMAATLAAAGTNFTSLARITFYVRDLNNQPLDIIRAVRDRWVDTERPPASALIGVDALFHPGALVEIDGVACLPAPSFSGENQ